MESKLTGTYFFCDTIYNLKDVPYYNEKYISTWDAIGDSIKLVSVNLYISPKCIFYKGNAKELYKTYLVDTAKLSLAHKGSIKKQAGDFIFFEEHIGDTIMDLSRNDKIKQYKELIFLNRSLPQQEWEIFKLEQKKEGELIMSLTNQEDKEVLIQFAINPRQLFGSTVHMKNKDFLKFVKNGGFRERFRLRKL